MLSVKPRICNGMKTLIMGILAKRRPNLSKKVTSDFFAAQNFLKNGKLSAPSHLSDIFKIKSSLILFPKMFIQLFT